MTKHKKKKHSRKICPKKKWKYNFCKKKNDKVDNKWDINKGRHEN